MLDIYKWLWYIIITMKDIRKITIKMLKEVQEQNNFSSTKMAALIGVSVYTYDRWVKGQRWTKSSLTLNQILKIIEEYHQKAS